MELTEKLFKKHRVYNGRVIHVRADEITLPDGKRALREFIEHPGAVCVLPFIDPKNIVMVKQFRYPVDEVTYELPAGKIDKNENPLNCVKRELEEETGFSAKKITKMISFWPTAAFSNEIIHLYVANGLVMGKHSPDEDEFLETVVLPFEKALNWVRTGRIKDSKSVISLLFWANNSKYQKKLVK